MSVKELVSRIRKRDPSRTEATLQSDIRQLLLGASIGLESGDVQEIQLEAPLGDHRRIDIELGSCVIEVKRDLERPKVEAEAVEQLEGYLQTRADQTGLRYVGILTDGLRWTCYHLRAGGAEEVARHTAAAGSDGVDALVSWLEGVLATAQDIAPTPANIHSRLGADSSSHELDRASLAALYSDHKHLPTSRPSVGYGLDSSPRRLERISRIAMTCLSNTRSWCFPLRRLHMRF